MTPFALFPSLLAVLALSACAVFEPAYPKLIQGSATRGQEEVSRLVAGMELGHFTSPGSYAKTAPRYETVIGEFTTVRDWVSLQTGGDLPSAQAAKLMQEQLDGCLQVVTNKANEHKRFGLQAGKAHGTMRVACAIPTDNIIH